MKRSILSVVAVTLIVCIASWAWPQGRSAVSATRTAESQRGVCTQLLLDLQPGARTANGKLHGLKVPKSMPRFAVPIQLPVYPGAEPVMGQVPDYMQGGGYALVAYTKSAVANYDVTQPVWRVTGWYRKAMLGCGFKLRSSGSSSGPKQPTVTFTGFSWNGNGDLEVNLSFAYVNASTRINYTATVFSYPQRPTRSYVPFGADSVWISYTSADQKTVFDGVVRSAADRQAILASLNDTWSQLDGGSLHTCLAFGVNARVIVTGRHGRRWNVVVDGACGGVSLTTNAHEGRVHSFQFAGLGALGDVLGLVARHKGE